MGIAEILDLVNSEDENIEDCYVRGLTVCDEHEETRNLPAKLDSSPNAIQEKAREIKAAFFAAKSADEVLQHARNMHFPVWLDYFIKMSPKEVQVKGQFDVRSLVAQLGPINKNA